MAAGSFPPFQHRGIPAYTRDGVAIGKGQQQARPCSSYTACFILSVQLREGRVDAEEPALKNSCVPAV